MTSWVQSVTGRSCPPPVSTVEHILVVTAEYRVEQLIVPGLKEESRVPAVFDAFPAVAGYDAFEMFE